MSSVILPMNTSLRYYFVACIDVLGQKSRLLTLNEVPTTPDEQKKALIILGDTAGYIMKLRNCFTEFFYNKLNEATSTLNSSSKDKQTSTESIRRMEALITSFSDTIVISIPLSSSSGSDPLPAITAIHSALYGICGIYLAALTSPP